MNIPSWRLVILAGIASFCANWSFAFQITYVNTSVDTFYSLAKKAYKQYRGCSDCGMPEEEWLTEWSTVVSMFYPGTIGGFLIVPLFTKWIGVKRTQGLMCIAATCGVLVHFLALHFMYLGETVFASFLSIARFLIGIQAGSSLCLLPLYIIEISPPMHRSFLNSFQQVSQSFATLLGLVLGSEELFPLGHSRYTVMQLLAVAPILCLLVLLIMTPATPTYLNTFKPECIVEADQSTKFYFGEENEDYRPLITNNNTFSLKQMAGKDPYSSTKSWKNSLKGFMIGSIVAMSYAFTGDDLIDTFSSQMLIGDEEKSSNVHTTTDAFTILISDALGVVLFVASIFGIFLADHYGRRRLVLVGLFGTCIANIGAVVFSSRKTLVAICFSFTKTFIGLGCGGPAWFITSELVSTEHAWIFQPLSTGILLATTMFETFFYLYVDALFGSYSLLILAAVPAFLAAILIYLYLPETRGRTNNEIQFQLNTVKFSGIHKNFDDDYDDYGTFDDQFI